MSQCILKVLLSIVILIHCNSVVSAAEDFQLGYTGQILKRQQSWPRWHLPAPLQHPRLKDDLVYPSWFEGEWKVSSFDLDDLNQPPILHFARFILDSSNRVIADRGFNAQSLAEESIRDDFLTLKLDPISPNRQLAQLTEDRSLETTVIGRGEEITDDNIFLSDELSLLIFHFIGGARIQQVEVLSRFYQCNNEESVKTKSGYRSICGEQWQAIYPEPGKNLFLSPYSLKNYRLILDPV